jgi:drug/metabolite transporter (DMT)-like permease
MIWLFVAVRVLANPFSNVFQKLLTRRGSNAFFVIAAAHGLMALGCLPSLHLLLGQSHTFWLNVSLCAVLAVAGNAMIVRALELSDLSVVGPINAYKSVVSLIPAAVLLHEVPGAAALSGIALIVAGSYWLVERAPEGEVGGGARAAARFFRDPGIRYRFGGLVLSAVEAVFLKMALKASSPQATFVAWAVLGFAVSAPAVAFFARERVGAQFTALRQSLGMYAVLAMTTALMQYTTLVTFNGLQVGPALALFQLSSLVSVLLGWRFFKERDVVKRLIASLVMAAGATLIVMGRR